MLSANLKRSLGSGRSQELITFTLHCIVVEMKAQSSDPEHEHRRTFRWRSRFKERFPRRVSWALVATSELTGVSCCRCCQTQPDRYVPPKVWTVVFPLGVVGNV